MNGELKLPEREIHGLTPERIRQAAGWAVRFADDVGQTPLPTDLELATLRDLLARTVRAHGGGGAH